MVKKRKGFTATQSKLTSFRMKSAMYGTHVPRRSPFSSQRMNADSVGFSNMRKNKRAARGIVDTLLPSTVSRESSSEYARRVSRREFTQEIQRHARVRRIVFFAVCFIIVLAVAMGVGIATFFGSLDGKMSLGTSDAASALVAPAVEGTTYTLVAADLNTGSGGTSDGAGADALALVRVDTGSRSVSIVSIPPNTRVTVSDAKAHPLRDASTQSDATLVSAVASLCNVKISHFVKIDAAGVRKLVDGVGGVDVNLIEEVDDPTAGGLYLPAGWQHLDGEAALTLLRASNFKNGLDTQASHQRSVLAAVSVALLDGDKLGFLMQLDSVAGSFKTDMGASAAEAMAASVRGIEASAVPGALMPGYETTRDGVTYYIASTDAWTSMLDRFTSGQDPTAPENAVATVDPGSFTITVRNGAAITGGATQIADVLKAKGFDVVDIGNTDSNVYTETLVVYQDAAYKDAAETVVSALGMGRVVAGAGYYTFDSNVLVVLGKDWTPLS